MHKGKLLAIGRTAEIYAQGNDRVLKLFHNWLPPEAIKREEEMSHLARKAGIPVPDIYDSVEVEGRHGIVFERIEGPSMLQETMANPDKLGDCAVRFARLHAKVHSIESKELPPLRPMLESRILRITDLSYIKKEGAIDILKKLPEGDSLCHWDFHPDNIIISGKGPVIIDWMAASQGDYHADIARTKLLFDLGKPPEGNPESDKLRTAAKEFFDIYIKEYSKLKLLSLEQVEAWKVPVAAARLEEGVSKERLKLLYMIENGLNR